MPDGADVYDLVADGEVERVGFIPRYVHGNRGRRVGDLLWTTGSGAKIASRRFIDVLESLGATGYRIFPVTVEYRDGSPVGDFAGLAVLDSNPSHDLYFTHGAQNFDFAASDRVVAALRNADVTALSITPFDLS
ncbi:hypothetical protein [Kribbella sp. CA-293567]|uniref:hypothetical protein n=1 Tax=Kribbella sp. CA-293567 TaxID=3002436 RepID=UPI0022DD4D9F|nr:hypothetical protein [Kribbella sp. CA-293567]WBQ08471.1 hypothetical protein OX958_17035 [Kribbella sp. CA-293567]